MSAKDFVAGPLVVEGSGRDAMTIFNNAGLRYMRVLNDGRAYFNFRTPNDLIEALRKWDQAHTGPRRAK